MMGNIQILVLEKEASAILEKAYGRPGFSIHKAEDVEAGIMLSQKIMFDLCVIDTSFCQAERNSVLQALRCGNKDLLFIVTERSRTGGRLKALMDGAYDYIAKPFVPEELETLVAKALNLRALCKRAEKLESEFAAFRTQQGINANDPIRFSLMRRARNFNANFNNGPCQSERKNMG